MLLSRWICLALLVFLFGTPSVSQNSFLYHSKSVNSRLPYSGQFRHVANYRDDIIEELAKDLLRPPKYVNITVGFTEEIRLQNEKPLVYLADVRLSDFRLSGYLQYRSFPMDDVLNPSGFRFTLRLSSKLDTTAFSSREFDGKFPERGGALGFRAPSLQMDTAVDTVIAGNFSFIYKDEDWQRFYARKEMIDDYYASAALIDSLGAEAKGWAMTDQALIPFNYIRLAELVRVVNLINSRDFTDKIVTSGHDPKQLASRNLALYKLSRTCQFNLAETLDKSGVLNGFRSADSLCGFFVDRLMRYIRLSSLMDNIHGKIYKDYLSSYYSQHVFENDTVFIRSVLIRMFPDARPDTLLQYVSSCMMKAYRAKAADLIGEKRFSDAVLLMENARSMAAVNPYLKDHNGWESMMSEAVNGIYNSYAGIASSSLERGNTGFAMEYLQKAEEYRGKYPAFINSDSIYRRVYRDIFIGKLDLCDSLLAGHNYTDALACLNSCESAYNRRILEILAPDISGKKEIAKRGIIASLAGRCRKALKQDLPDSALMYFDHASAVAAGLTMNPRNVAGLDSLAPVIAVVRVKKINNLALAYYRHRQFSRAILQFGEALKISSAYAIPPDPLADSVLRQSYKQWLLDKIAVEQKLIWSNKPDSALGFVKMTVETARMQGLADDHDILKALDSYRLKISLHACEMLEDSLGLLNIRAGRCFANKNFSRGAAILGYSVRLAGMTPGCSPVIKPMQDSLRKYSEAAGYQLNLDEADKDMIAGEYEEGMRKLVFNEKYYSQKRIDHFGIPLTSVYDYVISHANPFITSVALEYYLNNSDPAEALRYLLLLHEQGLPDDRSRTWQEKLAAALAARDKRIFGGTDPKDVLRRYSGAISWMARFNEVYLKEWAK
ncbi:MAG: hypothetical protein WCI48_12075 [Bacteroidota bacterium]